MAPVRIKRGDTVKVLKGRDRGKTGKVLKVMTQEQVVLIEKLNMVKRHTRPTQQSPEGGIVEKEAPMQMSNVALHCLRCKKSTRHKTKVLEGNKHVRICSHCGEII